MKKLSKFEIAAVKRTAQNVKTFRSKLAKAEAIVNAKMIEVSELQKQIDLWEAPIKEITGGFTSEEVLNGAMDLELTIEEPVVIDEEAKAPEIEVEAGEVANVPFWGTNNID